MKTNLISGDEGIAIVGIGCRFPGGANGPRAFWDLLTKGFNAVTPIPTNRPGFTELFDPDPHKPGRLYTRWGGFLDNVDLFDAHFFGISPREASRIDPQQRMLLELVWEACEDAGLPPTNLAGSRTGVFIGISTHDYGDIQVYPSNRSGIDLYTNSGTATSIAANRISYIYDLRGPSVAVDTACSSALTAVHLSCQSLSNGECDIAIAGGAQVVLTPELTIGFCKASMISRDGQCRAFDASGNGYVRSEGAGVVILKPLKSALSDGDPVYAVIRATAINQDGRTASMTVPSQAAQQAMIEEVLRKAKISAANVQYIEAHGTGTPVGDPIEARAIGAVMSQGQRDGNFCAIGSVKTNIGHLEAAAGIAGLIKVALAIRHRQIPPSLHFQQPNEAIDLDALHLRVVTELESWPETKGPATAGVNSFGFGGANAHALLQESPHPSLAENDPPRAESDIPQLLAISARSPEALKSLALNYSRYLSNPEAPSLSDICYSAAQRRSHHEFRLSVVTNNTGHCAESLSAFVAGENRANIAAGRCAPGFSPRIAFVFSGMGPQWWGMGRQLYSQENVFRETIDRCDEALRPYADWSLLQELSADEAVSRVASPELAQVTNFAVQVALAALWGAYGISPCSVIGHSGGAMAAAYIAGIYDLEDAIRLSYHRSRLQGRPTNEGRMLAVGAPFAEIASLLADAADRVSLAAVNGPQAITLSGDGDALEIISAALQERQIFARFLPVTIAYHSPAMDKIKNEFLESVADLRGRSAKVRFVSDTTGAWADGSECDADYWWKAIREPVLFYDGMKQLLDEGIQHFLEISPHPVLSPSMSECLKDQNVKGLVLPSLRRSEEERAIMLRSLGALYSAGYSPNWPALQSRPSRFVHLPGYPWQRERHWFEPASPQMSWVRAAGQSPDHPLLGVRVHSARPIWENTIGSGETEYLREHVVNGSAVYPAAAYVEQALAASALVNAHSRVLLRGVEFSSPLRLAPDGPTPIQLSLDSENERFEIFSCRDRSMNSWTSHARGFVSALKFDEEEILNVETEKERLPNCVDVEEFYTRMSQRGLSYGPIFRGIRSLWIGERHALGMISVPGLNGVFEHIAHPALLDGAFQMLVAAAESDPALSAEGRLFLPTQIREMRMYSAPGEVLWALASLTGVADSEVSGDIRLIDVNGKVCGDVSGLTARLVEGASGAARESVDHWLYEYRWELKPRSSTEEPSSITTLSAAALREVSNEVTQRADKRSVETGWKRYYDAVEDRLNELAYAYIVRALVDLGCDLRVGVQFSPDSLSSVQDEWRRSLMSHLLSLLDRQGVIRKSGNQWEATELLPRTDPAAIANGLLRDFPGHRLDVELLGRCGPRLPDVLAGRCDGRDILLTGEAFDFLEQFYRESPASAFYNAVVADAVEDLAVRHGGSRLRILEVGAGTGGTTSHILPRLDASRTNYLFTDISYGFIERAKTKFADYHFVTPMLFDVTNDLNGTSLQPGSFDIIIGANVLHATPSVESSVDRLKELLAPGGALLLLEITRHPFWLDIVFGLMDGWWKFEDRALRPNHPLMRGPQWRSVLERSGFEEISLVADRVPAGEEPAQTLVVGRKVHSEISSNWLIFADHRGVGRRLGAILERKGYGCSLVYAGNTYAKTAPNLFESRPDSDQDMARLLDDVRHLLPTIRGVIHLWSLDIPSADSAVNSFFATAQANGCGSLSTILQQIVLKSSLGERTLVIVTAGAQVTESGPLEPSLFQTPIWGFGRVMLKELTGVRCRMVDLSSDCRDPEIVALANEVESDDSDGPEEEIALRFNERFVHRLRPTSLARIADSSPLVMATGKEAWHAEISTTGSIDSLVFRQAPLKPPGPNEVEVAIHASSMNFRDIVLAMGVVPGLESDNTFGKKKLGSDFAGVVTRCGEAVEGLKEGDEVFGIAPGTYASYAVTNASLVVRKPRTLSMEEASTIPVVFVTAWYGLRRLARLSAVDTVLIHAASGGVGLAAIQICRAIGAHVFATAGSPVKRAYLESLGIQGVMDSRTTSFAREVRERTGGKGVDVILNSLPGEAMEEGISALAPYGRFIELGKADIYQSHRLGLGPFKKNLSLFAVDLDRMSFEKPEWVGEMLREVAGQFDSKAFLPLPSTTFSIADLVSAMRFMAQAKHIGKVVLSHAAPVPVRAAVPDRPPIQADASYLVTGGLGGLGLVVARWLIECGAQSVVLIGRSRPAPETALRIAEMEKKGARLEIIAADVSKEEDVSKAVSWIRANMPPLRGIIHAAMVLEDTPLPDLSKASLDRVMAPKVLGAWYLHRHLLSEPIDFFVSFSSITSLMGNPLQANYAAANVFLDSFASYRRAHGLAATTINWGVISGSGYVARHQEVGEYLSRQGYLSFTPAQTIDVLSELLKRNAVQTMAARVDWRRLADFAPRVAASKRIRHLVPNNERAVPQTGSFKNVLENESRANRHARLEEYLCEQVGLLLGSPNAALEPERPMTQLGVDSLIAAELAVVLERDLGVKIAGSQLLGGLHLRQMAARILQNLGLDATEEPVGQQPSQVAPTRSRADEVEQAPVASGKNGNASESSVLINDAQKETAEPEEDPVDYSSLEYSRWTPSQRIVRAMSIAAFGVIARIETSGFENIPATGRCLLAVNHLSMADVPLLLNLLPRRAIILAKDKYKKNPILNWFLSDMGQSIYVTPNETDEESMRRALTVLRAGGLLALAPEGTRSKTGGLVRGRTGVAYLATQMRVPVVPLAAWGQEKWRQRTTRLNRIPVVVRVGKPLYFPTGPTPPNLLRQYTDQIMMALAELLPAGYRGVYAQDTTAQTGPPLVAS